jgi:hypothetical protein
VDDPIRTLALPHGSIELPAADLHRLRTAIVVPLGRTAVLGGGGDGLREVLFLLTPRRVPYGS